MMAGIGTLYSWSVFVPALEAELAVSRSPVSAVFSMATACFTIGMFVAPSLERAGSPAARALAFCGLAGLGLWLSALGNYALFALGYGALFGLANGFGYSLSLQIVHRAPSENQGLLTGIVVASYMAGSAAGSPLLDASLGIWGFRATMLLLAAVIFATGMVVMFLVRNLEPDLALPAAVGADQVSPSRLEFSLLWACFFFSSLVGMMIIAHAAPIVESLGGARKDIALAATFVSIGNAAGRFAGGWLTDRSPAHVILGGAPALALLALLAVRALGSADGALLSLGLVGIGYGCIAAALPAAVAKRYGVANVSRIYGRLFTAWGAAGLLGPLAGGLFFDAFGNYEMALITAMIAAFVGLLAGAGFRFARR